MYHYSRPLGPESNQGILKRDDDSDAIRPRTSIDHIYVVTYADLLVRADLGKQTQHSPLKLHSLTCVPENS